MFHTLLFVLNKKKYFLHFFQPSLQWAGLDKLVYEHAFQPYTYSLRSFSRGQSMQDSDPPAIIELKWPFYTEHIDLINYELDIYVNNFKKLIIFNCGSSTNVICAFLLQKNMWEFLDFKTFKPRKTTIFSTFHRFNVNL